MDGEQIMENPDQKNGCFGGKTYTIFEKHPYNPYHPCHALGILPLRNGFMEPEYLFVLEVMKDTLIIIWQKQWIPRNGIYGMVDVLVKMLGTYTIHGCFGSFLLALPPRIMEGENGSLENHFSSRKRKKTIVPFHDCWKKGNHSMKYQIQTYIYHNSEHPGNPSLTVLRSFCVWRTISFLVFALTL